MKCLECQDKNIYRFHWENVCCRYRFITNLPAIKDEDGKSTQDWWMDRWVKQGDGRMVEGIRAMLSQSEISIRNAQKGSSRDRGDTN